MPRRRDRDQSQPDYVNLYFGFVVWRAIFAVAGKVLGGIALALYFIAYQIWPDEAPQLLADFVICAIGAGALAVLYIIPRPRRTMAEIEKALGWTPNPPPEVSWFRADGSKKQYDHSTGIWS